jgi:hypothetical protein
LKKISLPVCVRKTTKKMGNDSLALHKHPKKQGVIACRDEDL